MEEAVYKMIEITGSSKTDMESAIQNAITKTAKTIKNMRWFEVTSTRGYIENDRVAYWQVTVKIGFHIDEKIREESHQKASSAVSADGGSRGQNEPSVENKSTVKYRCLVCGYIYDPEKGDPTVGVKPGTSFDDLPDDWRCPECGVGKDQFEKI